MGLVHGRELLIGLSRAVLLPVVLAALACGGAGNVPDSDAPDSIAPDAAPAAAAADSAVTLVGTLPEGGPMPAAESAGGVPPYPGASVHTSRAQTEGMRTFEAYTPDDWMQVVAFFDSQLGPPAWTRLQAQDMVIYERGEDEAAITVSPWEAQFLRPGAPEFMQEARTAIGVAWRP
ncbi:MAG TPA: hypothetical protein VIE68_01270 [Gemmatimonadota bacterium]|jgi:hypothetical protein